MRRTIKTLIAGVVLYITGGIALTTYMLGVVLASL